MTLTNNFSGTATRLMGFSEKQDYKIGDILTNLTHWSNGGDFTDVGETACTYGYEITCNNIEGHEVDYIALDEDDIEGEDRYDAEYAKEVNKYGICYECYDEKEVIVDEASKFRIVEINEDDEYGVSAITVEMI